MIRKLSIAAVVPLALSIFLAAPSQVEAQTTFAPKVSLASDNVDFGVGLRVGAAIGEWFGSGGGFASNLRGFADFDYFFPDCGPSCDFDYWELSAGAIYPFVVDATVQPYAGAGIVYSNISTDIDTEIPGFSFGGSDGDLGLNLLGGLEFDLGSFDAFSEVRLELAGAELFVVSLGVLLGG